MSNCKKDVKMIEIRSLDGSDPQFSCRMKGDGVEVIFHCNADHCPYGFVFDGEYELQIKDKQPG
jgi:hypothetical protein